MCHSNNIDVKFSKVYAVINAWKWSELQKGYDLLLISKEDIISYAGWILNENLEGLDLIIDMIVYENVEEIIPQLVQLEKYASIDEICSKWIFAIIYTAYIEDRSKIYDLIENVYVKFGYPKELEMLIRYMPKTTNRSLQETLELYIQENKEKWCNA